MYFEKYLCESFKLALVFSATEGKWSICNFNWICDSFVIMV